MVSHGSQLSINFESFTSRQQEIIKVRIPHIGLIPKVIPLELFLHMVQYPGLPRMVLARCVDVFVENTFMFRFV